MSALNKGIDCLEIGTRAAHALNHELGNNATLGDLVQKTETDLLRCLNFGRKSLLEVKEALAVEGLHLGMSAAECVEDETKDAFVAGAIVRLKSAKYSSSPWMTVKEAKDGSIVCVWFNGNWDFCLERFRSEMLQHENEVSHDNPR